MPGLTRLGVSLRASASPSTIGDPLPLGTLVTTGGSSSADFQITTSVNISPTGADIVVGFTWELGGASGGILSCSDSAGNTYTVLPLVTTGDNSNAQIAYCLNAVTLPIGGTISGVVSPGSAGYRSMAAYSVTGILSASALDQQGSDTGTADATPTVTVPTLAQSNEFIFVVLQRLPRYVAVGRSAGLHRARPTRRHGQRIKLRLQEDERHDRQQLCTDPLCSGRVRGRACHLQGCVMGRLRLSRGRGPVPAPPVTVNFDMGAKTRQGFGGFPTIETANSTLSNANFKVDDLGHIVPAASNTINYGDAWTPPASPVTFTGAGGTTYVCTIAANTAHWRERTTTPGAVNQDDISIQPAYAASAPFGSQLGYYIDRDPSLTGVANGDTFVGRAGYFNPLSLSWSIGPHASMAGWDLTVRGENPDSGLNADGNRRNQHPCKVGCIIWSGAGRSHPVVVRDIWYHKETTNVPCNLTADASLGDILDMSFINNGFSFNDAIPHASLAGDPVFGAPSFGIKVNYCRLIQDNTFYWCGGGIGGLASQAHPCEVSDNDFNKTGYDHIVPGVTTLGSGSGTIIWKINRNLFIRSAGIVTDHPDAIQLLGYAGDSTCTQWLEMLDNRAFIDEGAVTQGIFLNNEAAEGDFHGPVVRGNIMVLGGTNALQIAVMDDIDCRYNTMIHDITRAGGSSNFYTPQAGNGDQGTDATFIGNVGNDIDFSDQLGTVVDTNNIELAATTGAMDLAFPNMRAALIAGAYTRAAIEAAATPANLAKASGGMKNLDGTYAGAMKANGTANDGLT